MAFIESESFSNYIANNAIETEDFGNLFLENHQYLEEKILLLYLNLAKRVTIIMICTIILKIKIYFAKKLLEKKIDEVVSCR